jgi:hypothetical protein
LDEFIYFRNRTFHGGVADIIAKSRDLTKLNTALLVNIRNFGNKLGLTQIDSSQIGPAVDTPDIIMTVFYEMNT